jgi:hypothetical protein
MAKALVSDEPGVVVAPLLPAYRPRPRGGRPPVDNRKALTGILSVLKSGILLPKVLEPAARELGVLRRGVLDAGVPQPLLQRAGIVAWTCPLGVEGSLTNPSTPGGQDGGEADPTAVHD